MKQITVEEVFARLRGYLDTLERPRPTDRLRSVRSQSLTMTGVSEHAVPDQL
jgi:hypothetical protein